MPSAESGKRKGTAWTSFLSRSLGSAGTARPNGVRSEGVMKLKKSFLIGLLAALFTALLVFWKKGKKQA
jgi:hypothetical protein